VRKTRTNRETPNSARPTENTTRHSDSQEVTRLGVGLDGDQRAALVGRGFDVDAPLPVDEHIGAHTGETRVER
jgi:hypothetical protein